MSRRSLPIPLAAWLGGAATSALMLAWAASGWWSYGVRVGGGARLGIGHGLIRLQNGGLSFRFQDITTGLETNLGVHKWRWWGHWHSDPGAWEVAAPLWALIVIAAAGTALRFWRIHRAAARRRRGRCVKCGYELQGLKSKGPCPECGHTVDA